jgi:NTE family protein
MMVSKKLFIFLLIFVPCFFFYPIILFPQNTIELTLDLKEKVLPFGLKTEVPSAKPVISLALSGGGARAAAHIGVIKAIEELEISLDHIIGTSMGSVIGGLYSAGYSIDELDSLFTSIKWEELFFLTGEDRGNLFVDQKITEDKSLLTVRLDGLAPVIPQSINGGNKISNLLISTSLSAPINQVESFDDFLYRFRAVATELVSGKRKVLSEGSLSEAMRASSSVSFLLPPIKRDSLLLVDGGLVDNLPIESASELLPDYIIASDATSSLRTRDELVYPWDIADQIVTIPSRKILEQSKKKADILITHKLNKRKNTDFIDLDKLISIGYKNSFEKLSKVKTDLMNIFYDNLSKNDIELRNLMFQGEDNEIEKFLKEKYSKRTIVYKSEILYDLYSFYEKGNYKSISATISNDSLSNIKVKVLLNPIVRELSVKGTTIVPIDSVNIYFESNLYKPFNAKSVLSSALSLIRLYRKKGYMSSTIENIFLTDNGSLEIIVNEGRIDNIVIKGNEKTLPSVIEREFPDMPGQYMLRSKFNEGLQNLTSTDLFDNICVQLEDNDNDGKNLCLRLDEKLPNVLRFGLRIDNENFTQAAIDLRNENLFGTGSEIGISIAGGSRNLSYIFEHKTNRIFNTYLTYKAQAFYKWNDVNVYADDVSEEVKKFSRSRIAEYRQHFYGGFLGLGANLRRLGTLTTEAKYEINEIDNIYLYPKDNEYRINIFSLKFRLQIDSQNKYPYPTKGININTFYETAQSILGGDVSYAKFSFDYTGYFTFAKHHTFVPKLIFGFADETLPLSQHFNFGGQFNFLGYREYEYRGRQILITTMQYRYQLPINIYFDTYFKIRYDLGSTWIEQEQIRFNDLKHGIGLTLSFDTPIGPADFSVGRSLLLKDTSPERILSSGPYMFYFTIGYYY